VREPLTLIILIDCEDASLDAWSMSIVSTLLIKAEPSIVSILASEGRALQLNVDSESLKLAKVQEVGNLAKSPVKVLQNSNSTKN